MGEERVKMLREINMKDEYSDDFDKKRKQAVEMSYYKYGPARANYGRGLVSAIDSLKLRLQKYEETGNREYLCDVANFAMFEYMFPQHPNSHYRQTDSCESPGVVGCPVLEAEKYGK